MKAVKHLVPVYFVLILLLAVFRLIFSDQIFVGFLQFVLVLLLAFSVLLAPKKSPVQKRLSKAFIFLIIGDFFLILIPALNLPPINLTLQISLFPFGVLAFAAAYCIMISAFLDRRLFGKAGCLTALPILVLFALEIIFLSPHVAGIMLVGLIIFGFELCCLALIGTKLVFQSVFTKKASWLLAISFWLLFLGDFAVGFNQFHPLFNSGGDLSSRLIEFFIVLVYLPGWTLLGLVTCSDQPVKI